MPKIIRSAPLLAALTLPAFSSAAEPLAPADHADWIPWPTVEPVVGSALDLSAMNAGPAGAHGRVIVKNGHFATAADGQRIRFWGCNISSAENFLGAEAGEVLARRLAAGGINIARLHHMDNPWSVAAGGSIWS